MFIDLFFGLHWNIVLIYFCGVAIKDQSGTSTRQVSNFIFSLHLQLPKKHCLMFPGSEVTMMAGRHGLDGRGVNDRITVSLWDWFGLVRNGTASSQLAHLKLTQNITKWEHQTMVVDDIFLCCESRLLCISITTPWPYLTESQLLTVPATRWLHCTGPTVSLPLPFHLRILVSKSRALLSHGVFAHGPLSKAQT